MHRPYLRQWFAWTTWKCLWTLLTVSAPFYCLHWKNGMTALCRKTITDYNSCGKRQNCEPLEVRALGNNEKELFSREQLTRVWPHDLLLDEIDWTSPLSPTHCPWPPAVYTESCSVFTPRAEDKKTLLLWKQRKASFHGQLSTKPSFPLTDSVGWWDLATAVWNWWNWWNGAEGPAWWFH